MGRKFRVAYVSSEASPFAKSGEMADVASSLPKYLAALGMEIALIMPKYRRPEIESLSTELVIPELSVSLGGEKAKASVYRCELGKYSVYFIDNPKYFWREQIYGHSTGEYLDNDERFVFFNRAVLEFLLKADMPVDIIHCNNWPTALIPVFLKTHYADVRPFSGVATVLTLHNIAYQGEFPPESLALTELNWKYFNPQQLAFNGKFNFLKAGVIFSDVINTVSSAYKQEIQTHKHGFGLGDILKARRDTFFCVRSGIDYEVWNPATDPYIAANYSASDMKGKAACKRDLLREFELAADTSAPVISLVSYLAPHKGIDLLLEAMDGIVETNAIVIICGQGDERYVAELKFLQKKFPGRLSVKTEMSSRLIHKIVAGSDLFLIPSLYEPCGLNQLYGFRYGTVPVVRATGGLKETVKPFNVRASRGNGFVFREYSTKAFLKAIGDALSCYEKPSLWQKVVAAGLQENYSWDLSAKRYARLYQKALEVRRGGRVEG